MMGLDTSSHASTSGIASFGTDREARHSVTHVPGLLCYLSTRLLIDSEIVGGESGLSGNTDEHAGANLFTVMEGEDEIRPARAWPSPHPTSSCGLERHLEELRDGLAMLQTLRQGTEGECLYPGDGVGAADPVGHHAWEVGDLGKPTAINFLFDLDVQDHGAASGFRRTMEGTMAAALWEARAAPSGRSGHRSRRSPGAQFGQLKSNR